MSKVTMQGECTTDVMQPTMDGGYVQHSYNAKLWRCEGCGLVWDKKWYAETCESRGHIPTWEQGPYGVTHVSNGVPQGNLTYYTRQAVRRDKIEQPQSAGTQVAKHGGLR
jgi:hypothetical protein